MFLASTEETGLALIELLFAAVIVGVLAFLGAAHFQKVIEQWRADNAKTIMASIAAANRARKLSGKAYAVGVVNEASVLVAEEKLSGPDWERAPYVYYGADDGGCVVAKAMRRDTSTGFCMSASGKVGELSATGSCSACPAAAAMGPLGCVSDPNACSAAPAPCPSPDAWGVDDCGQPCSRSCTPTATSASRCGYALFMCDNGEHVGTTWCITPTNPYGECYQPPPETLTCPPDIEYTYRFDCCCP